MTSNKTNKLWQTIEGSKVTILKTTTDQLQQLLSLDYQSLHDQTDHAIKTTTQDRTGQDRTGQDRTGQDRTFILGIFGSKLHRIEYFQCENTFSLFFWKKDFLNCGNKPLVTFIVFIHTVLILQCIIISWNILLQYLTSLGMLAHAKHDAMTGIPPPKWVFDIIRTIILWKTQTYETNVWQWCLVAWLL